MAKFCIKCGSKLDDVTKVCPNCDSKGQKFLSGQKNDNIKAAKAEKTNNAGARKEVKKRKRALRVIIVLLCVGVVLMFVAGALVYLDVVNIPILSAPINNFKAKKDISVTLGVLLNRLPDSDAYILGNPEFFETTYGIFTDNEVSKKISQMVVYNILKVETDKPNGTVEIEITAPNIQEILDSKIKGNLSDDVDVLLKEVSLQLDTDYPVIDKTFICSIQYLRGHWYLAPNTELFDAMSGNLYSFYNNLVNQIIEEMENLAGGAEDAH